MKALIIILFSVASLVVHAQTETDALDFKNLFDASAEADIACYRIPAIMTAANGDLIATIDERVLSCGDLKRSKDINIVMRRSTDNGDSWPEIETIVDYPLGKSASDPSMILDKVSGVIFLFFNFMDLDKEKDVYYLKVAESLDHGQTWSSPTDITSQITKPEWHGDFKFITSGRGYKLAQANFYTPW